MKLNKYFCNLNDLHINTEKNRCYYIPSSNFFDAEKINLRDFSDRVQMLNGEWDFSFYDSIYHIPSDCIKNCDEFKSENKIDVPSVWQNYGYDLHQYTNVRYPIPYEPPYVPKMNPCGVYKREFEVKDFEKLYLNFEGVDSCFYLWINKQFVGYSQVSHCTSEFDITQYVNKGINNITVVVLKWCDGTYLEDQDKLRTSGIFRDVFLLYRPQNHIFDYSVTTELNEDYSSAIVNCKYCFSSHIEKIDYSFCDSSFKEISNGTSLDGNIEIKVANPLLWTAETPNLYYLRMKCNGECISQQVGMIDISKKDGILKINNTPIKLHGVNRHDSHPQKGPAVSYEDVLNDILMMKRYNVNAIRTSHYPNAPYLPLLCNKYGLYLLSEADFEAHGVRTLYGEDMGYQNVQDNLIFRDAIIDRQKLLFERDKNNVSIIMWSAGNESGWGDNIENALAYLKSVDKKRLTHYESMYCSEGFTPNYSNLDTYSRMYPRFSVIEEYMEQLKNKSAEDRKPFVMCEYSHSMGNGPGDLEDYNEMIYKYPEFAGGFVWEWSDHAVQSGTYNVNQPKYLYGGDFGDTINDGNFCMDGMVRPERKPYQSLLEFANVMRPIRFEISNGNVYATNMLDFVDASEIYDVYFEVTENGSSVNNESKQLPHGKIDELPKLKPHVKTALPIHISNSSNGHLFVKFEIVSKIKNDYISQGDVVGFQQIEINDFVQQQLFKNFGSVDFSENELYIKIKGNNFSYVFDKLRGSFCKITYNKCDLIKKPLEFVLWRAPTDNDMYIKKIWESAGYNRIVFRPYDCTIERYQGAVKISCLVSVASVALQRILLINSTYMINGKGQISVNLSIDKNKVMPTLPKFGIRFFLEESFSDVQYLGYGPGESYIDKHYATYFGEFKSNIDGLYENYYNPQENGSHFGCEKLTISSPKRSIIIQAVKSPFSFNASYYTYEELTEAKHDFELKKSGYTVLSVDYKQNGVGSNSCGPELLEKYKFNDSHFDFSFIINPA